jgi:hypothetical protein
MRYAIIVYALCVLFAAVTSSISISCKVAVRAVCLIAVM